MLNLRYKTSFPKNPNQSRQLTVLTVPDSALCIFAARLYYFSWHQKSFIAKFLRWDRNGLYVYQILLIKNC